MAAIYEKTLKRKDFSGIVDKEKTGESTTNKSGPKAATKEDKVKAKADAKKANDPKAGAGSKVLPFARTILYSIH